MTKLNIDIETIIKDAFMKNLDTTDWINELSEDIRRDNPEWWAEMVVKPLRETLAKAISENKDLLKEIIENYLYQEAEIDTKVDDYIREAVDRRVASLTRRLNITLEDEDE